MRAVVVQIDGREQLAGPPVVLRAASHDDPGVCHLDEKTWWPTLSRLPTLRYDLFDGAFGGQITAPSSSLIMQTEPWPDFGGYSLADAGFRLWTGEAGAPWSEWTLRFDGRVKGQPRSQDLQAQIEFAVDDAWLDAPVLGTYAGTGGAEGGPEVKGAIKPLALGAPRYASGVLVDAVNTVIQLSGAGPIAGIDVALDKLSRFPASVGDFANHAALVAAAIPAGRFGTCLAEGKVRHGAPPEGLLSYLLRGDTAGRASGFPRTPGELILRIAQLCGGAGKVDEGSLAALDVGRPMPLSIMVTDQTTARELIQRIAQSVNCVAGVSWLGKLFVARIGALGDPVLELRADGSALPAVSGVEQITAGAPWWRVEVQAQPTWTLHGLGDVAFTAPLFERGRFDPTETYREGHIVDLGNGSRWLYTSTVPGSSAPPSAAWSNLSPALGAADISYGDGSTLEQLKPATAGADKTAETPQGQAVDAGLKDDGTVKAGKVPTEAVQVSAIQKVAFATLSSEFNVAKLSTATVFAFSAIKDRPESLVEVVSFVSAYSGDDLQAYVRIYVDENLVSEGQTQIISDGVQPSAATVTAFAVVEGLSAGPHTYRLDVFNYERDVAVLTLRQGGIMKVTELKVY